MHMTISAVTEGGFDGDIARMNEDGSFYTLKPFVDYDNGYQKSLTIDVSELPKEVAKIVLTVHNC